MKSFKTDEYINRCIETTALSVESVQLNIHIGSGLLFNTDEYINRCIKTTVLSIESVQLNIHIGTQIYKTAWLLTNETVLDRTLGPVFLRPLMWHVKLYSTTFFLPAKSLVMDLAVPYLPLVPTRPVGTNEIVPYSFGPLFPAVKWNYIILTLLSTSSHVNIGSLTSKFALQLNTIKERDWEI